MEPSAADTGILKFTWHRLLQRMRENVASAFSLKGCQRVAGGRSEAQTTGSSPQVVRTPAGMPPFSDTGSACGIILGVVRWFYATLRRPLLSNSPSGWENVLSLSVNKASGATALDSLKPLVNFRLFSLWPWGQFVI